MCPWAAGFTHSPGFAGSRRSLRNECFPHLPDYWSFLLRTAACRGCLEALGRQVCVPGNRSSHATSLFTSPHCQGRTARGQRDSRTARPAPPPGPPVVWLHKPHSSGKLTLASDPRPPPSPCPRDSVTKPPSLVPVASRGHGPVAGTRAGGGLKELCVTRSAA